MALGEKRPLGNLAQVFFRAREEKYLNDPRHAKEQGHALRAPLLWRRRERELRKLRQSAAELCELFFSR